MYRVNRQRELTL